MSIAVQVLPPHVMQVDSRGLTWSAHEYMLSGAMSVQTPEPEGEEVATGLGLAAAYGEGLTAGEAGLGTGPAPGDAPGLVPGDPAGNGDASPGEVTDGELTLGDATDGDGEVPAGHRLQVAAQ